MKKQVSASTKSGKGKVILFLLLAFSATIGFLVGKLFDSGFLGSFIGVGMGTAYGILVFLFSDKLILASLKAKPILIENNAHLYKRVGEIAQEMHIKPPLLYYIDDSAMNILSLGKSHDSGKIVITKGLMEKLTSSEVEAVMAHELAHIKALDTETGEYVATVIAFFPFMAESLRRKSPLFLPFSFILSLFSPISGFFIQSTLSPKREFEADAYGVLTTRYPQGLAQALEKITQDPYSVHSALHATAHLFIVNPFHGKANRAASSLFMTHPPVQERIKVLQEM